MVYKTLLEHSISIFCLTVAKQKVAIVNIGFGLTFQLNKEK